MPSVYLWVSAIAPAKRTFIEPVPGDHVSYFLCHPGHLGPTIGSSQRPVGLGCLNARTTASNASRSGSESSIRHTPAAINRTAWLSGNARVS